MNEDLRVDLSDYVCRAKGAPGPRVEGRVSEVVGQLVLVEGLPAVVGGRLETVVGSRPLALEVLGFRRGAVLAAPLGAVAGLAAGARVRVSRSQGWASVGAGLLGRVIDSFGRPLDAKPPPRCQERAALHASPPAAFSRRPIVRQLETRVRAIDALVPVGVGQRIGLFAGTGIGKSTLLGMLCRHTAADVMVVGLIGERGREVGDFVRGSLGPEGLARSVVVAATSDTPPLVRAQGALLATAIAEHFRDQGKSVLLVMDSITRYAMALREASLAAGEPPLTKGYTPTVFAALPSLLERAGNAAHEGSITAVYTVLVEGDDLQDPIADAVRSILDGHIVLSRALADRGLFPAVDVLRSVSRVAPDICSPEHLQATQRARDLMATYGEAADLIQIGAYVHGSDPRIDAARLAQPRLEALVRQGLHESVPRTAALDALRLIVQATP
jgi:FliI/YscN family ATPase